MKQLLSLFVIGAIVFSFTSSCVESSKKFKALQAQLDSIQTNYGSQYGGLDEAFSILNEVEDGLRSIRESENLISFQSKEGMTVPEGSRAQIESDMESIKECIAKYKEKIEELEKKSNIRSKEFKKRLQAITKELEEKNKLVESLQEQLQQKELLIIAKDQEINKLGNQVSNLQQDVTNLAEESSALKEKVANQDRELYSAYYIIGTKGQLIDAGVMTKGGLFKSAKVSYNAEKSLFVKIDYREITTINTNAQKAKVMSIHPKGTYMLEKVDNEMVLTIYNPDAFWEQTKYLVIQAQ